MVFGMKGAVYSHVGLVRENNEDNFYLGGYINEQGKNYCYTTITWDESGWYCAAVFDGMGGEQDGEIASRIAAETLRDAALEKIDREKTGEWTKEKTDLRIRGMILESNKRIVEHQERYQNVSGTTAVIFCTDSKFFKIYHCGDSRAYLMRQGKLVCITCDQTLASIKIEAGIYQENDPRAAYEKHKLTAFLGCDRTKERLLPKESAWIPIEEKDYILLCSDGLTDLCDEKEIREVLKKQGSVEEKCFWLLENAIKAGGKDNVTCLLIQAEVRPCFF